jgi:hypothetical protein
MTYFSGIVYEVSPNATASEPLDFGFTRCNSSATFEWYSAYKSISFSFVEKLIPIALTVVYNVVNL